jgi:fermentation-respiration switch protein FrsA (DUF1100 family)
MRKGLLIVLIVVALLLIVGYSGMGYVIYSKLADVKGSCDEHIANRPDRLEFRGDWPPFDVSPYAMADYEVVRFPSRQEGLDIAAWWVEQDSGAPAVILVDGLGGCKNSIAILVPAGMLWRNGFSVLLLDLRDTGDSSYEDGRSSIGNEEYLDVLGAWDWLVETQGIAPERIGLFANSLGGATALYAFSKEPRVAALFLQSSFGNLGQVIAAELKRNGYPAVLVPSTIAMGRVIGGENLVQHDPISAIAKAGDRPVYIVHSRADTRIAVHQSEQLAAAAQAAGVDVTTWFPDQSEHVQTPAVYPEEFKRRMTGFFEEALAR